MKRLLITGLTIGLIGSFGIKTLATEFETTIESTVDFFSARYYRYDFKNYPPKTYRGFTLVLVEKTKDGYKGLYV